MKTGRTRNHIFPTNYCTELSGFAMLANVEVTSLQIGEINRIKDHREVTICVDFCAVVSVWPRGWFNGFFQSQAAESWNSVRCVPVVKLGQNT